jgi:hypothetical protein
MSRKGVLTVFICLAPAFFVITYVMFDNLDCIPESEAEVIFSTASEAEYNGEIERAYYLYKQIDGLGCDNYPLRSKAFDKAVSLSKQLPWR